MALLNVLFGFRRIALSRVKTYNLALIGWITAMTVRVRAVSSLEALSLGALFAVQVCYGCEGTENEVACCSLLRHDLFICHVVLLFVFFQRLCAS
jgi:hypothetical protein